LAFCVSPAQETNRQPRPSSEASRIANQEVSELENGNLLRVAASLHNSGSASEGTGILVELKRWVAREASDNGQIVSDDDLPITPFLTG